MVLKAGKSKIREPAWLGSGEDSFPTLHRTSYFYYVLPAMSFLSTMSLDGFVCVCVLGMEPSPLHMLGKSSMLSSTSFLRRI
jgi:hypothetical protein